MTTPNDRPYITLDPQRLLNRDLVTRQRLLEWLTRSDPPYLCRIGEQPILRFPGLFSSLPSTRAAHVLTSSGWIRISRCDGEGDVYTRDVMEALRDMLDSVFIDVELRNFRGLLGYPQFEPRDGSLRLAPHGPSASLEAYVERSLTIQPQRGDLLRQWFSGLAYAYPVYERRLLGWALALLCRAWCGEFPHLLIASPAKSCGKSRTARALSFFLTGSEAAGINYTGTEAEMETRLGSLSEKAGPTLIFLDNIRAKQRGATEIRSQFLSSAATAPHVSVRSLYKGMCPISFPTAIMTGVGASVESDLHDKVWSVLLAGNGLPRYADPDPLNFVRQHRAALLGEAAALLGGLDLRPLERPETRFPRFELVVRRGLAALGLSQDVTADVDTSDTAVLELHSILFDSQRDAPGPVVPFVELVKIVERYDAPELQAVLRTSRQVLDQGKAHALRQWVARLEGRSFRVGGRGFSFRATEQGVEMLDIGAAEVIMAGKETQ